MFLEQERSRDTRICDPRDVVFLRTGRLAATGTGLGGLCSTLPHFLRKTWPLVTMKFAASFVLLVGSAAAFTSKQSNNARLSTAVNSGMDDLKTIAEKSNPVLKVQ